MSKRAFVLVFVGVLLGQIVGQGIVNHLSAEQPYLCKADDPRVACVKLEDIRDAECRVRTYTWMREAPAPEEEGAGE